MAEVSKRDLVDLLLERDVPFDDEQYALHRRKLADQLENAKRNEKTVRIATLVTWLGALSFLPLVLALQRLVPRGGLPAGLLGDVVVPGLMLLTVACGTLAIPMLALYWARYRGSLVRARENLHDTVLSDLQKTIEQCKARLDDLEKSH